MARRKRGQVLSPVGSADPGPPSQHGEFGVLGADAVPRTHRPEPILVHHGQPEHFALPGSQSALHGGTGRKRSWTSATAARGSAAMSIWWSESKFGILYFVGNGCSRRLRRTLRRERRRDGTQGARGPHQALRLHRLNIEHPRSRGTVQRIFAGGIEPVAILIDGTITGSRSNLPTGQDSRGW